MDLLGKTMETYGLLLESGDPRVKSWALMSSPLPTGAILIVYLLFVYYGPAIMANRKPWDLRRVLLVYNFGMVSCSVYMAKEFAMAGWLTGYSLGCQPVDYTSTGDRMAWTSYLFFISKLFELMDTVIFILKKNFHQMSFLHVFHHGFLPFNWWFGIHFVPGGWGTFHAFINTMVHSVMYMYYFLSACGPSIRKYLWWKKYITTIQITQFFVVISHSLWAFLFFKDCGYSIIFVNAIFFYNLCFLCLFVNFYLKTYKKQTAKVLEENKLYSKEHKQNGHLESSAAQNGHVQSEHAHKVE